MRFSVLYLDIVDIALFVLMDGQSFYLMPGIELMDIDGELTGDIGFLDPS